MKGLSLALLTCTFPGFMSFQPCQGRQPLSSPAPPGFDVSERLENSIRNVHVRNTFIEVDEDEPHADLTLSGLDLHNAPGRTWRRGHLRCASEPMSFFLSQPPWEPMSLSPPPFSMSGTLGSGDSRPVGAERGRACTTQRSLNQSLVATIQESLDEYEHLRHSLPQYVKTPTQSPPPWSRAPMLIDPACEIPSLTQTPEPEELARAEWLDSIPTRLALQPTRFRHARQRSRTIQEDSELENEEVAPPSFEPKEVGTSPWDSWDTTPVNVRVRNTFIEVDEGSVACFCL